MRRLWVLLLLAGCGVDAASPPPTTVPTVEQRALTALGHPVDLGGEGQRRSGCGGYSTEPVERIVQRDCLPTLPEGATIVEVQWSDTGTWQSISLRWRES